MLAVSWQKFHEDAKKLAEQIRPLVVRGRIKAVYGIPRGGLVLAVYLSHTLNLPLFLPGVPPGPEVLVVDDNVITGHELASYEHVRFTAALIVNPLRHISPTFFARESPEWPIFPWEADSCAKVSK